MKEIYDNLSIDACKMVTNAYSTSFSLGIQFLNKGLRNPIHSIYGFVRIADEIVDSFEGYDKRFLLEKFRKDTEQAIEMKISTNPILNSFQQAVHTYNIDYAHIDCFLKSMEMDLDKKEHSTDSYKEYILGSAEVVGLMCLHVFTKGDKEQFNLLKPYAMKLGAAFQKVNFLRDLKDDFNGLGRTYFPTVEMKDFTEFSKREIETEIEADFQEALIGIKKLPSTSKGGVYLAYVYYRALFDKIKRTPVKQILSERIRINNGHKFGLMVNSMVQYKFNLL